MSILAILVVSGVTLGLEILLTSVFSVALFASHGAVAISLALLGVAAGGVLAFLEGEVEPEVWRRRMAALLALLAVAVVGSIWGLLQIEFVASDVSYDRYFQSSDFIRTDKLFYGIPLAFLPFLLSGYLQAGIFRNEASRFGTLYGADLIGATAGSVLFPQLLSPFGLRGAVLAMGALVLVPAVLLVARRRLLLPAVAVAGAVGLQTCFGLTSSFRVQYCAGESAWLGDDGRRVAEIWTPMARTAVLEHESGFKSYVVNNSFAAYAPATPDVIRRYEAALFTVPLRAKAGGDVLVIASGGGPGITMAHHLGARSIDAVEIAGGLVRHIVDSRADDPGNPYLLDGVTWAIADARSFVMRKQKRYDLILLRTVEGFSATGQLSSAWSTNFITTQEAVAEYLSHLGDDGLFAFSTFAYPPESEDDDALSHPISRIRARSLVAGLRLFGASDPAKHLLVVEQGTWLLFLVKPTPFSLEERRDLLQRVALLESSLYQVPEVLFPNMSRVLDEGSGLVQDERTARAMRDLVDETEPMGFSALGAALAPAEDRPLSDDRPYKYKSGVLNFDGSGFEYVLGDSYRKLLAVVSLLALVFVFLPFAILRGRGPIDGGHAATSDAWSRLAVDGRLAWITALTGFGFMFLEMASMFRFQLYLQHPTTAMIVVISSMILGAGLGSLHASRVREKERGVRRCSLLAVLGALLLFGGSHVLHDGLLSLPLAAVVVLLFAAFCALGFALGHVVPLSLAAFAGNQPRLVAWCWAVTVTFSVLGAIVSAIVTRSAGSTVVAALGLACYAAIPLVLACRSGRRTNGATGHA